VNAKRQSFPDPKVAAQACAEHVATLLDAALSAESLASLAVSGGTTPRLMFEALVPLGLKWSAIHLFWVDERPVPPDHAQSNYRLAEESLILPAHVPSANVHRIHSELPPAEAARRYVADIRSFFGMEEGEHPRFDVVQRGMGADAHTASLFPGEPLIADREQIAGAVVVEKLGQTRITLMPGTLLAAKHTVCLVTGSDKSEAVRSVFEEAYNPVKYPAQLGMAEGQSITWFLDTAAAALLM
jgi:6-phosphogluconolactonase